MNSHAQIEAAKFTAPKVYSYTRFSTPEQAAGDSRRRQSEGVLRWLRQKNAERKRDGAPLLTLDERLSLADLGVSAYRGANTGQDAGLGGFLHACREGLVAPGSYLVVESLDRISRQTPRRVSRYLDDIVDAGVTIATLSDGQEYNCARMDGDPTALLIALMVSWRAHEESKVKGQRLSAAWEEKRARVRAGKDSKLTARGPAWLLWDGSQWIERAPHADTVRRIFRMALDGIGEAKTAETFNREGVPVMGRGKRWHRSTVCKVLRNPSVIGQLVPGRMDYTSGKRVRVLEEPILGAFPSVVSNEDWAAVRALKDGKAPAARGRGAGPALANVFAGLAECPECGARMTRVMKGKGPKGGKPKLVCTAAKTGASTHGYHSVALEGLEETLRNGWQAFLAEVPSGAAGGTLDSDCSSLEAAIAVAEDELEAIAQQVGAKPTVALCSRRRAVEASLISYRADLAHLQQAQALADHGLTISRVEALADVMGGEDRPDLGRINAALRTVFDGVVIDYPEGLLRFRWRQGGETLLRYDWRD